MGVSFIRVELPRDRDAVVELLATNEWPFHRRTRLAPGDVDGLALRTDDVDSYCIVDGGHHVGLIRMFDLGDVADGSPLFDLRIAADHRGRGLGTAAVNWLTTHLFERFDALHRIEATTRVDNAAMRHVLERCGYRREGRLREAWLNDDGSRTDTMIYAILRTEWTDRASDMIR